MSEKKRLYISTVWSTLTEYIDCDVSAIILKEFIFVKDGLVDSSKCQKHQLEVIAMFPKKIYLELLVRKIDSDLLCDLQNFCYAHQIYGVVLKWVADAPMFNVEDLMYHSFLEKCIIDIPCSFMKNPDINYLLNDCKFCILRSYGHFQSKPHHLCDRVLDFLEPESDSSLYATAMLAEAFFNLNNQYKEKLLLSLNCCGIYYKLYNGKIIDVMNLFRVSGMYGYLTKELNLKKFDSAVGSTIYEKNDHLFCFDGAEVLQQKFDYFLKDLNLPGLVIENVDYDLSLAHPDSIYQLFHSWRKGDFQIRVPSAVSLTRIHKRSTSEDIYHDKTKIPRETCSTNL